MRRVSILSVLAASVSTSAAASEDERRAMRDMELKVGRIERLDTIVTVDVVALCQRCHILHDEAEHLRRLRLTYLAQRALGDLFTRPYPTR